MATRNRIITSAAALILAAGAGAAAIAAVPAANAATVACGSSCMALTAQSWGPGDVTSVASGIASTGQSVILARAAEFYQEDFILLKLGTAGALYSNGKLGAGVGETWPSDQVYEYLYAPGGELSTDCLGIATAAENGSPVVLMPCGISGDRVFWIALAEDGSGSYQPLISGGDSLTSNPYVLTAGALGAGLTTTELSRADGIVAPSQMWASRSGVYYPYQLGPGPKPPVAH
jgi:hypothetical protein